MNRIVRFYARMRKPRERQFNEASNTIVNGQEFFGPTKVILYKYCGWNLCYKRESEVGNFSFLYFLYLASI